MGGREESLRGEVERVKLTDEAVELLRIALGQDGLRSAANDLHVHVALGALGMEDDLRGRG